MDKAYFFEKKQASSGLAWCQIKTVDLKSKLGVMLPTLSGRGFVFFLATNHLDQPDQIDQIFGHRMGQVQDDVDAGQLS